MTSAICPAPSAVVIPSYRQWDYVKTAVRTALATTPGWVLLVDDGSPDWSPSHLQDLTSPRLIVHRFKANERNLTRSWNWGLVRARELGAAVTVVTNSDVKFPPGWYEPLAEALTARRAHLVGPVTNAPGHKPRQHVAKAVGGYRADDSDMAIAAVEKELVGRYGSAVAVSGSVNGFCMAALTETWWAGAYGPLHVFNPVKKMVGNEDELMRRWAKAGRTVGFVQGSFVFHYRSVSRGPSGRAAAERFRSVK